MTQDEFCSRKPFSVPQKEKDVFFSSALQELSAWHRRRCEPYSRICRGLGQDMPFLPVSLFKSADLLSIPEDQAVLRMFSSGTTGQTRSRIFLDAGTSAAQQRALCSIAGDFLGTRRLPMLILDSRSVLDSSSGFSARGAAIAGFSLLASHRYYLLDEHMDICFSVLERFIEETAGAPAIAFGFTSVIWESFCQALKRSGRHPDLSHVCLIHGGGWKKMQDQAVSPDVFRKELLSLCGISRVINYYGMVEQTGSIFMECEYGHLHASLYSDVEILRPSDFSPCLPGEQGLIALRSFLPRSYPGHCILTEDLGRLLGTDDCPCGRKGRYFSVDGRIPRTAVRGCSDTREISGREPAASVLPQVQVFAGTWPAESRTADAFSPLALDFLEQLSQLLLHSPEISEYPDAFAFGFWCRRRHLEALKKRFLQHFPAGRRGRGMVLHITPSNMPAMFAYSFATSLMAGNSNIVRLSERALPETHWLCTQINSLLELDRYSLLRHSNCFVTFPRSSTLLEQLSAGCRARILWGGDSAVSAIHSLHAPDGCLDLLFPDRCSICVLDVSFLRQMGDDDFRMLIHHFYQDTYGADQNACSSPQTVIWLTGTVSGADTKAVRTAFWTALAEEAGQYRLTARKVMEKYDMLCRHLMLSRNAIPAERYGNRLWVCPCSPDLTEPLSQLRGRFGLFFEKEFHDLHELIPFLDKKIQTVVTAGISPADFRKILDDAGCGLIDRIVLPGEALQFDTTWDRKDLLRLLSE